MNKWIFFLDCPVDQLWLWRWSEILPGQFVPVTPVTPASLTLYLISHGIWSPNRFEVSDTLLSIVITGSKIFGVRSSCLTWCPLTSNCSALSGTIAVVCYDFFRVLHLGIKVDCEAVPWPQPAEAALTQLHIVSSHTLRFAIPPLDLVGKLEAQRRWLKWFLKLLDLCPRDDSWPGTKNPVLLQSGLERNSGVAHVLFSSSFLHARLVEEEVSGCYNK